MIGFELTPGGTQGAPLTAAPLAAFFRAGGGQRVALAEAAGGGMALWSEVGPSHAACMVLDNDDPTTRLSWRETLIAALRSVYTVKDMALTGSWSQLQSSGSGLSGSYTGNRAVSTSSTGATATVTVDRAAPYDLWVHYTGRTGGGYLRVDIDGSQTLVNEIDDPAGLGFRAFSTYAATDMTRRQSVRVASGLTGSHDVTVSLGGIASPGGNQIMLEALSITADLSDSRIVPPLWAPNTAYAMGDEVQWGGTYYAARANATSGTTPPSHTTGIASDGALDWRADNRPTYPEFVAIDYASEREYALRFDIGGVESELGGQTHGNEVLVSRTVALDGQGWTPPVSGSPLTVGAAVTISEDLNWQADGGTPLGTATLTRSLTPGQIQHSLTMLATGPTATLTWLYPAMLPLVHWDGESGATVVDTVHATEAPDVALAGYAGSVPADVSFPVTGRLGLSGTALARPLTYGCEVASLAATGNILTDFTAFLRPNIDGASASGSADWPAKAYFTPSQPGLSFGAGDAIAFLSRHVITVS